MSPTRGQQMAKRQRSGRFKQKGGPPVACPKCFAYGVEPTWYDGNGYPKYEPKADCDLCKGTGTI